MDHGITGEMTRKFLGRSVLQADGECIAEPVVIKAHPKGILDVEKLDGPYALHRSMGGLSFAGAENARYNAIRNI